MKVDTLLAGGENVYGYAVIKAGGRARRSGVWNAGAGEARIVNVHLVDGTYEPHLHCPYG